MDVYKLIATAVNGEKEKLGYFSPLSFANYVARQYRTAPEFGYIQVDIVPCETDHLVICQDDA